MKSATYFFIYFISLLFISSCNNGNSTVGEFVILPTPQSYKISGKSDLNADQTQLYFSKDGSTIPLRDGILKKLQKTDAQNKAQIVFTISDSPTIEKNGYTLNISKNQIDISSNSKEGLFHAFITLEQLMEDAQDQKVNLPVCEISDFPKLQYRAIHLDVKHHREKKEYYYKLINQLAKYKINGIIAEMEDKLAYVRQPKVGAKDALSIDEWKQLSEYAKDRFIEISPLIQGLGHASFILKHNEYKSLRDDPKSDWAFNPLDPKTYEVQFDLYLDAIEATPHGKYLHVGGDEVHTTGRESGKSALELQLSWLDKVCKFAADQGRIPIFWDDMPLKHAGVYSPMFNTELGIEEVNKIWKDNEHKLLEFLDQFPKNCIYMRWNYSSPEAVGNQKSMEWFREHGLQVMGATAGQTRWVLMPQNESNINSIASFAQSSIEEKLDGLLLTLWDDDSPHFELYKRGIIAFAQYTWKGSSDKEKLKSDFRHRHFGADIADTSYAFIDDLEEPVAYWRDMLLKEDRRNYLPQKLDGTAAVIQFPDLDNLGAWTSLNENKIQKVDSLNKVCIEIGELIKKAKANSTRNTYTLEIYEMVNELCKYSFNAFLMLRDLDQSTDESEKQLAINNLSKLQEAFSILRARLESTYAKTRVLDKGDDYILDQDHHRHLANQTTSFDWQLYAEILFLDKLQKEIIAQTQSI